MFILVGFSAFSIFLGIAAFGFFFLIFSLIAGDLFGHGDVGGHDVGAHGEVHGGVSFFSSRVLSVFVTAFGGFGAIGIHLEYSVEVSTLFGVIGGLFFGGIIYLFASFLYSQQASSDIRTSDLVGETAQVTVAIPKDGIGQVRMTMGESVVEKIARAHDGGEIPAGTLVKVEAIIGEDLLVRRPGLEVKLGISKGD
jgi:membrane protein implicated in regulation of membrane protease activity